MKSPGALEEVDPPVDTQLYLYTKRLASAFNLLDSLRQDPFGERIWASKLGREFELLLVFGFLFWYQISGSFFIPSPLAAHKRGTQSGPIFDGHFY